SLGRREFAENAELHLPVAHYIRIRRDSLAIPREQILDDPVAVLLGEAENPELDPEGFADRPGVADVLLPGTIAGEALLVRPVFHVGTDNFVPLLQEQGRRDAGVHTPGHCCKDLRHRRAYSGKSRFSAEFTQVP